MHNRVAIGIAIEQEAVVSTTAVGQEAVISTIVAREDNNHQEVIGKQPITHIKEHKTVVEDMLITEQEPVHIASATKPEPTRTLKVLSIKVISKQITNIRVIDIHQLVAIGTRDKLAVTTTASIIVLNIMPRLGQWFRDQQCQ
jgi:hypothetical protein